MQNKIIEALKAKKGKTLTESSINLYLTQLKKLNDDKPITNLKFLNEHDKIAEKISKYKPNTQRNKYIAIVSVLKEMPNQKKNYDKYFETLTNLNKTIQQNDNGEKSETQKKNWIEWKEVEEIKKSYCEKVNKFKNKKTINSSEYEDLLKCLVLSLYTDIPPRRNKDYQTMIICEKEPSEIQNANYLILKPEMKFIFNDYKSVRTHGKQEIKIPENLKSIIKTYLKFYKENDKKYFLLNNNGKPFETINSLTLFMNRIFDKKISSSMLRHIYLSKYEDVNKEQKLDAKNMGHTLNSQAYYIRK